jgi:hypothetical protein
MRIGGGVHDCFIYSISTRPVHPEYIRRQEGLGHRLMITSQRTLGGLFGVLLLGCVAFAVPVAPNSTNALILTPNLTHLGGNVQDAKRFPLEGQLLTPGDPLGQDIQNWLESHGNFLAPMGAYLQSLMDSFFGNEEMS